MRMILPSIQFNSLLLLLSLDSFYEFSFFLSFLFSFFSNSLLNSTFSCHFQFTSIPISLIGWVRAWVDGWNLISLFEQTKIFESNLESDMIKETKTQKEG
jgi:hypothetical protein